MKSLDYKTCEKYKRKCTKICANDFYSKMEEGCHTSQDMPWDVI